MNRGHIMSDIKVSVIIPVYNTEQYLGECIDSVLRQTLNDIEIVIVDDGSTDSSGKIADEYAVAYHNLTVIHQENQSQGGARNTGLYVAQGKYIQYLDSDDVLFPETLENLFYKAEQKEVQVVVSDAVSFCEEAFETVMNDYTRDKIGIDTDKVWRGKEFWNSFYKRGGVFINPYLLFCRRDFLLQNGISFEQDVYFEDNEHGLKIHLLAQSLVYLPERLYGRRYRRGSTVTTPCNMKHLLSQVICVKKIWSNIISLCELTDDTECVSIYLASNIRKIMNIQEQMEVIEQGRFLIQLEDLFEFISENREKTEDLIREPVFKVMLEVLEYNISQNPVMRLDLLSLRKLYRMRNFINYLIKRTQMQDYQDVWVSIVIPAFNAENYIEECIESVLAQSFPNLEILVIDDGSTDGTADICKKFVQEDERIKYFYKFNGGSTSARKLGIQNATGKYIMFIDADDYIKPDMLSYMVDMAERNNADIVTDTFITDVNEEDYPQGGRIDEGVYQGQDLKEKIFPNMFYRNIIEHWGIWPTLWGKIFRKNIIETSILRLDEKIFYGEDVACLFPACLRAECICVIKKYFYHYRVVKNSVSKTASKKLLDNMFYLHEYLYDCFSASDYSEILLKQLGYYMLSVMNHAGQKLFHLPYPLEEAQHLRQSIMRRDEQIKILKSINNEQETSIKILKDRMISTLWLLPFEKLADRPNIILYGAGKVGQLYYKQISQSEELNLIAWADKAASSKCGQVFPEQIKEYDYDVVVIAVANDETAMQIQEELLELGEKKDKIFWEKPRKIILS